METGRNAEGGSRIAKSPNEDKKASGDNARLLCLTANVAVARAALDAASNLAKEGGPLLLDVHLNLESIWADTDFVFERLKQELAPNESSTTGEEAIRHGA